MAISRTKAYKDIKKLEYKTSIREGTFIADYVKTKYQQIHEEAAALYNSINKLHPNKPNLRKTMQYRMWKNQIAQTNNRPLQPIPRQRDRYINPTDYPDITMEVNNNNTSQTPKPSNLVKQLAKTNQFVLEIPLITVPRTGITQVSHDEQSECCQIEECDQPQTHIPEEGDQPQTHILEECDQPQTHIPEEGDQPQTHILEEGDQPQTRIPEEGDQPQTHILEEGGQPQTHIPEEGQQSETPVQESLDPTLLEAIPPDVLNKIITDLQKDPDLKQIMDDFENQYIHDQTTDLEINFPDLEDPLQEEIDALFW